ncbi:MAG: tRNA threonylcarbamoyladenosine dehydratase [Pseudoramibacter sp.]|jgi:tRNA A37 threonylcarbamoyladenosine dehydratase
MNQLQRTELLLGSEAMETLRNSHVAVFGLGGVGGFAVEAIARCGVGHIDIIDKDTVDITNLNRQIIATRSTIGQLKTQIMKDRIYDINPHISVKAFPLFFLPDTKNQFDFTQYDYVIDAVDTVTAKLTLIEESYRHHVPIISSMGAGNKLDPTQFKVADIFQTSVDPLAKVIRHELRKRHIDQLKVVYSTEKPQKIKTDKFEKIVGSVSFVPSVAGLIMAGEVIKDLIHSV